MDAADYEFVHIAEFDMKELKFETLQQCGKKRAAEEGIGKGTMEEKKAKVTGPVKIGREAAAKYWQSLIDAGRGAGMSRTEEMTAEAATPLRSLTLEVRATKILAANQAFIASMRAKVNTGPVTTSALNIEDAVKFGCTHCDKTFATKTALGQHVAAKHGAVKG